MLILPLEALSLLFWLFRHIHHASHTFADDMSKTHDTAAKLKAMHKMSAGFSKHLSSAFSAQAMHAASTLRKALQSLAAQRHTTEGAYKLLAQFASGMTVLGALQLSALTIEMQFDWPEDWSGNLTLFFKEITVKAHDSDQTITVGFAEQGAIVCNGTPTHGTSAATCRLVRALVFTRWWCQWHGHDGEG